MLGGTIFNRTGKVSLIVKMTFEQDLMKMNMKKFSLFYFSKVEGFRSFLRYWISLFSTCSFTLLPYEEAKIFKERTILSWIIFQKPQMNSFILINIHSSSSSFILQILNYLHISYLLSQFWNVCLQRAHWIII